ncbi:MAG TPA: PTS transporter subunit EIIC, partial [Candidatus Dormibacteraeota bacterium]|nr:PTS transporter subunit EIIC [Candidatus Dormibacteraeota bacterium]
KAKELSKLSVPVGILSGLIAGGLYNRFFNITLPSYLSFFGGRRFVPIVSGLAGLGLAVVFGTQWQRLEGGMDALSRTVLHAGAFGLFAYGVLNRVLIVTGLHHIINNIAWFLLGDYHGTTGDLKRFFAGDPTAGAFMSGFFPVMMFGLPAACLAMYHTALPSRRAVVGGLLGSIALTSFLTGVTEPIEFTFIFLAPALYAVHALLTGVAFIIMNALGVRLGFSFSAGFIDYFLNFNHATRPLLLLPVGALYFALYYFLFRFVIVRFDLHTPGRDPTESGPAAVAPPPAQRAHDYLAALGGAANIVALDACATRLRLRVASQAAVDAAALKRLGAAGLVRPGPDALQVVVGPVADQLAGEMRAALRGAGARTELDAALLLAALGGRANVRAVEAVAGRLRVSVSDPGRIDVGAIRELGVRGVALPTPAVVHVLTGPGAREAAAAIERLLK